MSLSNDIVKCRLRRIDSDDYAMTFTPDERETLRQIFPEGVCDYTRPGVGQRDLLDTWLYTDVGEDRRDRGDCAPLVDIIIRGR